MQARYSSDRDNKRSFRRRAALLVAAFAILALCAGSTTLAQSQAKPAAETQTHPTEQAADSQVAIRKITPEMHASFGATLANLQPSVKQWMSEQARVESQRPAPDPAALERAIRARFGKNLPGTDVAELEFVVLMLSIAPQYNALLQSVEEVKAHRQAKQALGDAIGNVGGDVAPNPAAGAKADTNAPCITANCRSLAQAATQVASLTAQSSHPLRYDLPSDFSYAQAQQALQQMRQDLKILNLSSETEQQRLQTAQQGWSQIMDIISHAMKAMNGTSRSIVQNLK